MRSAVQTIFGVINFHWRGKRARQLRAMEGYVQICFRGPLPPWLAPVRYHTIVLKLAKRADVQMRMFHGLGT